MCEGAKDTKIMGKAAIAVMTLLVLITLFSMVYPRLNSFNSTSSRKAAIVDQLSISQQNEEFVKTCMETFTAAGFDVDYIESKLVTVNFYKELPSRGYTFIVLRVHSTEINGTASVGLFTSEVYDNTKYRNEAGILTGSIFGSNVKYFGISPEFVTESMNGRFEGTTIILMGCDGSKHSDLGEAFVNKGARVFIGWTGNVDITHTDAATIYLLQTLIQEKKTLEDAIMETNTKIGPDPVYGSVLRFYPYDAANDTLFDMSIAPTSQKKPTLYSMNMQFLL